MRKRLILLLLSVTVLFGQTTGRATLLGTVRDSSGAVVAGAKVTVRSVERSFVYESETTPTGDYYVPYLTSGTYQVTVEASGFKRYVREGILLRADEMPRLNIMLEVGNVTESITVSGKPPLLETETAGSGQILEEKLVWEIPVMQKQLQRVLLYMPGMTTVNGSHVLGQRQRAIGLTMDGIGGKEPVVGQIGNVFSILSASLDSVQEFKLWTTGMPAEFGHSAGTLTAVSRSGTNQFHGSIEDRYINVKLIHRQYFQAIRPTGSFFSQPVHEWGATAGGPIVKNKTFYFVGFQHHYNALTETFIGNVPSQQMYQGNFDFGPNSFPIYDPASTRQNASGGWIRDPIPNNRVPQARFDPVARNLLAQQPWKEATAPGILTPGGPQQNLVIEAPASYNFPRVDVKIDHQFGPMHKIFGRYSIFRDRSKGRPTRTVNQALLFGSEIVQPMDFQNIVISDTYTINPTTINELRLGFNRRRQTREPQSYSQDWAGKLGIPNVSPETFPDFRGVGGAAYFGLLPGGLSQTIGEEFTLQNGLTKVAGKHTVKAGYEFIRTRYNSVQQALPSGQYRMGGTEFPFRPNTGNDFANFLLGNVARADFTRNTATWLPRWSHHAWYVQDSWKALPNLSVEVGVRWSYETPFRTKWGQQSQFDPSATDPISGLRGAILHPEGALAKRDLNNFQPRLGWAWNFHPKLVFRGNFGLMTVDLLTNAVDQNFEEYFATAVTQSLPGDPRTVFRLSEGPPSITFITNRDGSVPFQGANYSGRRASWYDPGMRMPYTMNWSGGIQYQFSDSWLMETLYQGSAGVGLLNNWDIDAIPLDISKDPAELDRIFRFAQDYKPWPQFGQVQHYSNYGHSTYHGVTLKVEKRYSRGLTLNAFYTFSKTINDYDDDGTATGITFYNRALEKGRASYDTTHRFIGVFTAELPFGRGRKFLNVGGWKDKLLGGWNLLVTQTLQSGPPMTVTFAGSAFNYLPGARIPNLVLPRNRAQVQDWEIGPNRFPFSAQNRYFDFAGFEYPAAFAAGNAGRNTFEAPGLNWTQTALSKEFAIGERLKLTLRWDFNNAFKQPQFANPNTVFNTRDTANFGTFSANRGSISDVGTSRAHHVIVGRLQW